jgi:hypothetical protein
MKAARVLLLAGAIAAATVGSALAAGALFSVSTSGVTDLVNITLCLNGKAALSCQNVTVSGQRLSIRTTVPNHTYPYVGIKVNNARYSLANPGSDCVPASNGYCLFEASATKPASITLRPATKPSP